MKPRQRTPDGGAPASNFDARVRRVLDTFGFDAAAAPSLAKFIGLVEEWNRKIDLTAARSADELVDLMLADAALIGQHLAPGVRVVDVGTGAGAPGLSLALLRPDIAVTLVEPLQKRVAFLRTALGTLGAAGRVHVDRGRGEELVKRGKRFDVALSRATLPPPAWLALGVELADEVWVLLARDEPLHRPGFEIALDRRYVWPLTGAERRAVRYVRGGSRHGVIREQGDEPEQRHEPERGGQEE